MEPRSPFGPAGPCKETGRDEGPHEYPLPAMAMHAPAPHPARGPRWTQGLLLRHQKLPQPCGHPPHVQTPPHQGWGREYSRGGPRTQAGPAGESDSVSGRTTPDARGLHPRHPRAHRTPRTWTPWALATAPCHTAADTQEQERRKPRSQPRFHSHRDPARAPEQHRKLKGDRVWLLPPGPLAETPRPPWSHRGQHPRLPGCAWGSEGTCQHLGRWHSDRREVPSTGGSGRPCDGG